MHPPLKTFMDWHQIFRSLLRQAIFFFISQEIVFEEEIVKKVPLNQLYGKTMCFMNFYSKCHLSEVNFSTSDLSHWKKDRFFPV